MTGNLRSIRLPAGGSFRPLRLIPQRARRGFRRLGHTLRHTLHVSSCTMLLTHGTPSTYSRFVPSAWGTRRDEYRWLRGRREDIAAFREAAAIIAKVLVCHPIAAWKDLLPGEMHDVIGNASTLYLADYWTYTLHHLVWSGKLPYAVQARWERGRSIDDEPFCFVSELPTDLAEASREALILFKEAAEREITDPASFVAQFTKPLDLRPYGLPIYDDGQWRLPGRRDERIAPIGDATAVHTERAPKAHKTDAVVKGGPPVEASAELPADSSSPDSLDPLLTLDDQTFTVRYAGRSYRFTARNKQLFALLERISRRPGYRALYNDLRSVGDVWDGVTVEDSTIRGAVARLRKLLTTHGMAGLAGRIVTGTYRGNGYVMLRADETDEGD